MKKKSLSISDFKNLSSEKSYFTKSISNIKTCGIHSKYIKPELSLLINSNIHQKDPAKTGTVSILPISLKSKPKEPTQQKLNSVNTIDSLEKCRTIFNEIIKKDKTYGVVLSKIKEVYERELKKSSNPYLNPRPFSKTKSVSKTNLSKKTSEDPFSKTDSVSNLETLNSSYRNAIPNLSLQGIKKTEFQEEFMSNFKNFSESWRKLINK